MVFWKAPGLILDAPELDFGASKAGFQSQQRPTLAGSHPLDV